MAYVYMQLRTHVTIFSNDSIIPTGFKFTELAACSYVLLLLPIQLALVLCPDYLLPSGKIVWYTAYTIILCNHHDVMSNGFLILKRSTNSEL